MKRLTVLTILACLAVVTVPIQAHTEDAPLVTPLFAGQTEDVGDVLVWNDADYLYVKFVTEDPWYMMETHVHVATSPDGIPQTKKGNPIPGQFQYGSMHGPTLIRLYKIPLEWSACTPLYIAAHTAANIQQTMWVYSDGTESFYAKSGPGTTGNPNNNPLPPRSGDAVPTWNHPSWISLVNPQFTYGQWIWESYRCLNPIYGDVVDFEKEFVVPGLPGGGTLWITVDNGFEAFLNGTSLITDGLSVGWRNSDLKEASVSTSGWNSVEVTDFLAQGANKFRFETANEYFDTDDGHGSPGTTGSNPGGLIYEALITYYEDGETAWGDGTEFVEDRGWATYFCYEPCKDWSLPTNPVSLKIHAYPGASNNYFDLKLWNVGGGYDISDGVWTGWCADEHVLIYLNTNYTADVYSSLDPDDLPSWAGDDEQWDYVNYILNHKHPNASMNDIQQAIWYFTDAGYPMPTDLEAAAMVNDALANGAGFYPTNGQFGAVILAVGPNVQLVFIEVDP